MDEPSQLRDSREWKQALRAALRSAMKSRDHTAMRALRSAIGALDNAESVDATHAPDVERGTIAGGVAGLGAGEVTRRELSAVEVLAVLCREVDERRAAAAEYEVLGQHEAAASMRAEADVIAAVLGDARATS